MKERKFFFDICIFVLITLISCLLLSPLVLHPATRIADDADGLLGAWTIQKVQDNILTRRPVFDGNIFYPSQSTILFSDAFVTSAILSFPLRAVTNEPLVTYSFTVVTSLVLTYFSTYLLFKELLMWQKKENRALAFCFASLFTLSTAHMVYIGHLHVFALQYVIFAMWSLVRFFRTKKMKWIVAASIFAALQIWQSIFLAYYVIFFSVFFLFLSQVRKLVLQKWRAVLVGIVLFLCLGFPIVLAYTHAFAPYNASRDIREAIHFSLFFPDLWGQFFSPFAYVCIFIGICLLLRKKKGNEISTILFALALFSFLMSLGPLLHWGAQSVKPVVFGYTLHIPLPYAVFYYIAPGFKAFRTPSRFFPLTLLSALAGSMMVIERLHSVHKYSMHITVAVITFSLLWDMPIRFITMPTVSQYPASVSFLKGRPEHVLMKLPMWAWGSVRSNEDTYQMLYSLTDGKTLVNGQSGFFPPDWLDFQHAVDISFPTQISFALMRQRGVELLLIQKKDYPNLNVADLNKNGTIIYDDTSSLILRL